MGSKLTRPTGTGLLLAMLSGFAALGYEIVWTRQLGIWLGHELVAVLAVLSAFFGGSAVGALALGRRIERARTPVLWYAACEGIIGLWALALAAALPAAAAWLAGQIGPEPAGLRHWLIAFLGPFVLLFPACCAMGATLPALERTLAPERDGTPAIGAVYAASTAGGVLGVLTCAFLLVQVLGLATTARACAALNLLCAGLALARWHGQRGEPALPIAHGARARSVLGLLAATGALGIGYEVLAVRVLSQITESTVYTFALLLAVYLLGSALGAALYQRRLAARGAAPHTRERLLLAAAAGCWIGAIALGIEVRVDPTSLRAPFAILGEAAAALAGETVLAIGAFGVPTLAMGALFSHLCVDARRAGIGWGQATAWNTLGAALAPLLFGVLLLPVLGAGAALLCIVLGYLLPACTARERSVRMPAIAIASCALAMALVAPSLAVVEVPAGGRLVHYAEGVAGAVSIVEDADGVAVLRIDNRAQEGSSASLLADARQAWLPLLLHERPRHALFLGLGTGVTARAATWDPGLEVDAVELIPEVVAAAAYFAHVVDGARAPRIVVADARRYVRATPQRYDVIVADLFHPARAGAGSLYTLEHFAAVRERLAPGGLFCQWLPVHQLDLATLRSIVSAFLAVYPDARALLATNSLDTPVLGLVSQPDGDGFAAIALRDRRNRAAQPARLASLHLEDELAVLGSFVAGARALRRFSGDAPANTDDRPRVAQRAPYATYAPASSPRARLAELLEELEIHPADVLSARTAESDEESARLASYWRARDRFLELGMRVPSQASARDRIEQLRAPLLAIVTASPDFRPAYDPLLRMAAALMERDAREARALLGALASAQPEREEARLLLQNSRTFLSPERGEP